MLYDARRAVEDTPRHALALLRKHEVLYPRGVLAQEREVLMIDALHGAGLDAEALRRTERFLARYPDSFYAKQMSKPSP